MFQIKWQNLKVTGIVKENFAPESELVDDNFLPKDFRVNCRKTRKASSRKTSAEKRRNSVITERQSKICLKRVTENLSKKSENLSKKSENLSKKSEIFDQNFSKIVQTVSKDLCRISQTENFESRCRMAESTSGSGS